MDDSRDVTRALLALRSIPFDSRTIHYSAPPHLIKGDDWHSAYVTIIESALAQLRSGHSVIVLPGYPAAYDSERSNFHPIFEITSYWEGAIYYLCLILGFNTALEGLLSLERIPYRDLTSKDRLFYAIWNSHQQLPLLRAFLISTKGELEPETNWTVVTKGKNWDARELNDWVVNFKKDNPSEMFPYQNPLYCGTNGLHLGGIEGTKLA